MPAPENLLYLPTHEWHRIEGDMVVVGITQFAADELTDITYLSLPKVGQTLDANARFGEIESVKATSDLYVGLGGVVEAVNEELLKNPGTVNIDPYGQGWMIKLKSAGTAKSGQLLSAADYLAKVEPK